MPGISRWGDRRRRRSFGLVRGMHMDLPLLSGLMLLAGIGLFILYSASGQDMAVIYNQCIRLSIAFGIMFFLAQIPPHHIQYWSPWFFSLGILLLLLVMVFGAEGKGAQRWLDLGVVRFQPSELMKIAVPMMIAWYLSDSTLPPKKSSLFVIGLIIIMPVFLIFKQPDLGTSLLIASSGCFVLLLAGIQWRIVVISLVLLMASAPVMWYMMHDYQRARVTSFLNPESDPMGSGYHIIQSKIAIGSGGFYGKGWLNGSQAQLEFLPERRTDFIFAVLGEEFGLIGAILLLLLYLFVITRGLYIATQAQNTYTRLLSGGLILTFFVYVFVNIGMVSGVLPVVGLPLPLISYGGTSMVTLMSAFGILMSIQTHRKLISS